MMRSKYRPSRKETPVSRTLCLDQTSTHTGESRFFSQENPWPGCFQSNADSRELFTEVEDFI